MRTYRDLCTFRRGGIWCGRERDEMVHVWPNEPMSRGLHVWRHDPKDEPGLGAALNRLNILASDGEIAIQAKVAAILDPLPPEIRGRAIKRLKCQLDALPMDDIVRTAILSEVAAVRHERELARAAAATALTNDRGGYWRHRADGYNLTLRSLVRVLEDIREGTARLAAEELDAARVEARLDPEPSHYEDWTVGELVEAFGK